MPLRLKSSTIGMWSCVLLLLAACGGTDTAKSSWRTATADRGDVQVSISATGTLRALSTVDVGTQVSGRIDTVEVDFNERVTAGQVIARLDPANLETRRAQATADLANARAGLIQAEAARKLAEVDLRRKRDLAARKLVSAADLDLAQASFDEAAARISAARASIQQREAALAATELDLGYSVIRSPVDGVVLLRAVEPGQTVAASLQTPVLFRIAEDLTRMQIDLSIDEADVGQIREGMPVRFTVDSYADRPFTGVVHQVRLAATTVNNVVTFPVVVEVANPDGALLPGMTANAEIEVARRNQVLRVPNAALRFKPTGVEAPTAAGGGGGWADDIAKLAPSLSLSNEQQTALDAVLATMRERARERAAQMARAGAAGGAPGAAAGGGAPAGAGGGDWRARAQAMVKASLQPFRDTLTAAQQAQWDTALEQLMTARRVTVWVLRDGKPEAISLRAGVSDASHTEVVGGELADGATVLVGEAAA